MKIIAVYSNKGGVGKTATSVNMAHLMAESGYRVLLCDLDQQGASSFYFKLKPSKHLGQDSFFTRDKKFKKSIQPSHYPNLDVVPAHHDFKDFDIFLASQKGGSKSLFKRRFKAVKDDYDIVILDCPPTLSALSDSVFRHCDELLTPVIPTTLSERTLEQLYQYFIAHDFDVARIHPFFSMVQKTKRLHVDTMHRMQKQYPAMLDAHVPFSSDVEKMGVTCAPVTDIGKGTAAAMYYRRLWREFAARVLSDQHAA
ncbi:ParA family protein [Salinivibrio sp. IB872]|uniref:ParA family protein n=1 Tax=Salinivibrio sp. IB872 TaxID=1766123 RepID=UPI000986F98F|nr:AAA family ATPase [Salinivibrio sp. IB872]OOF25340.1 cobyrinic acid a,c-diamide synthase [Salinivibrio sp. IB872]